MKGYTMTGMFEQVWYWLTEEAHLALCFANLHEFDASGYEAMISLVESDHDAFLWYTDNAHVIHLTSEEFGNPTGEWDNHCAEFKFL